MPEQANYGSFRSPITTDFILSSTIGLDELKVDAHAIYYLENRPNENGRSVLVKQTLEGSRVDCTPAGYSVRSSVHEYGGGSYCLDGDRIYFQEASDQGIYRYEEGLAPIKITKLQNTRYADMVVDPITHNLLAVREDHRGQGEPINTIVCIDAESGEEKIIDDGHDFYASIVISSDGRQIAWLTWDHPDMPWDHTKLWIAKRDEHGRLESKTRVKLANRDSVFGPRFSPDDQLYFVSDQSGYWNLYRYERGGALPLCPMKAEFGRPQWIFGMSTYDFIDATTIAAAYCQEGIWHLMTIDTKTRVTTSLSTPYPSMHYIRAIGHNILFIGASATTAQSVILYDVTSGEETIMRKSFDVMIDPGYLSSPESIAYETPDGLMAHAFYYPPHNQDYIGTPETLPPLLVLSHGGPTSATEQVLDFRIQYYTSRGFAVLHVNYGGSTGFGRGYRERLDGRWGVVDVDDCVAGALFLADQGKVDRDKMVIRGASAGGYTTLCALTFADVFAAGASYYGISDIEALIADTHKFEAHYMNRLIGPYPMMRDVYRKRSPIHYVDNLNCPVIFFQGLDDHVVPPSQAQKMVDALHQKAIPVAYLTFEGEGHGFRQADTIKKTLEAEYYFYSQILGFEPADDLPPIQIENFS